MDKLSDILDGSDFRSLVAEWKDAARAAARLKLEAKRAFCEAYVASEGRNETARTSEADLKSLAAQTEAEEARIDAKAAEFLVDFALSTAKAA